MTEVQGVAKEIMKQLQYYAYEVRQNVEEAQQAAGKEMIAELKTTSPQRRPSYSKGWRIKKTTKSVIVHNATDYQLTHLLEYGHPAKGRGRDIDARPHIRPAELKSVRKYLGKIERAIKQ